MKGAALLVVVMVSSVRLQCAFADSTPSGGEYRMPRDEIGDDFFSFLVALEDSGDEISLDKSGLHLQFPAINERNSSLFGYVQQIDRRTDTDHAELQFSFLDDLRVPVPFGILWYHPISIDMSGIVLLRESRSASRTLTKKGGQQVVLSPEYELRLERGHASIRIDAWLTVLTVGLLADFSFEAISLFKNGGVWYGLLAGRGPGNRLVSWLYDLKAMRVVLPLPDEFAPLASDLVSGVR
jgi:hypothetical protein